MNMTMNISAGYWGGGSDGLGMPLTAQMMKVPPKKVMIHATNPPVPMNAILFINWTVFVVWYLILIYRTP